VILVAKDKIEDGVLFAPEFMDIELQPMSANNWETRFQFPERRIARHL
jgi:hypothetical protein